MDRETFPHPSLPSSKRAGIVSGFKKADQPGPRHRSSVDNEADHETPTSEPGQPFSDLEMAYLSCSKMAAHLLLSSKNSTKVRSWVGIIDRRLDDIVKVREQRKGDHGRCSSSNAWAHVRLLSTDLQIHRRLQTQTHTQKNLSRAWQSTRRP